MSIKKFFIITAVLFLAAACNQYSPVSVGTTSTPTPTVLSTTATVYENANFKISILDGWTAREANQTVYDGNCVNKQNCTNTPTVSPNPAAVNITKGKYILYINTQASQASGIEGGRFAEIAMGAPSADAVVTEQPSPPCGTSETESALIDSSRVDLYINNQEDVKSQPWCKTPSNDSTVWYFSYITDGQSYFNYYNASNDGGLGYVITMAYNSKDINSFPVKGSSELNSALDEMSVMAKSLEIKIK